MGPEIIPVGKIDPGCRHHQAVDEGVALGVENPGRFHLRQRSDQLFQPQMQQLLARNDLGVGNVADDLGHLRQAAVDGLEHFQRMLVRDIQRALDFTVGGFADRDPGDGGCKYKQGQREGQRSDHHPLQQSQRITLLDPHGRSGSVPSLTQSFVENKVGRRRELPSRGGSIIIDSNIAVPGPIALRGPDGANGSRECAPDDGLRVIRDSRGRAKPVPDCASLHPGYGTAPAA